MYISPYNCPKFCCEIGADGLLGEMFCNEIEAAGTTLLNYQKIKIFGNHLRK